MAFRAMESMPEGWKPISRTPEIIPMPQDYFLYVASRVYDVDNPGQHIPKLQIQPEDGHWVANGMYWPVNGYMDFVGWGSTDEIDTDRVTFKKMEGGELTPVSEFNPDCTAMSIDFGTTLEGDKDILYTYSDSAVCADKPVVPLVFSHATANLALIFSAGDTLTEKNLTLDDVSVKGVALTGTLNVGFAKGKAIPTWNNIVAPVVNPYQYFSGKAPKYIPEGSEETPLQKALYIVPFTQTTSLTMSYRLGSSAAVHSFTYKFPEVWGAGCRYTYRFTCTLKEIHINQGDANEENWNTEIGGGAFEPNWTVEISTGAAEATWKTEIDGSAYEMHWTVEMQATALEALWVTETQAGAHEQYWNNEVQAGATENIWNTETGVGANEQNWNKETSIGASEGNWKTETGGNAYEADWIDGGTITIGGDPTPPVGGE